MQMVFVEYAEVALEDSTSAQGCCAVDRAVVPEAVEAGVVGAPEGAS